MGIWRQGDVLPQDHIAHASLKEEHRSSRLVVVTHDCDLGRPGVTTEVLIATPVVQPDGNYTRAQNARALDLPFANDGQPYWMRFRQQDRLDLGTVHEDHDGPADQGLILAEEERRTLRQWLAARYARAAFAGKFEDRLRRSPKGNSDFIKVIDREIRRVKESLVGVFFDLNGDRVVELPEGEPYVLNVALVYDTDRDAANIGAAATAAAEALAAKFHEHFGDAGEALEIALESCVAIADRDFSILDLRRYAQWRVDYLSFDNSDEGAGGAYIGHEEAQL